MAQKNKKKPVQPQLSPNKLIKERGRSYPIHKCLINSSWQAEGLAFIMVIRKMGGNKFLLGSYMVDIFCLGIKDAFVKIVDEDELNQFIKESQWMNTECDITLAQNIIYGAMEYAEDLGFKPHPDFGLAQYVLDDIEDVEYMDIEFGKNGKPLYIQGDNDTKYLHILATLDKNIGAGNYEHILEDELVDDFDERTDDFDEGAEGLTEDDKLNFRFAYTVALSMDGLEHAYQCDYEEIPEEIRRKDLEEVRDGFMEVIAENKEENADIEAFEAENPMINMLSEIVESLLDGMGEYEETFGEIPDSFRDVALYFYSTRVKEEYLEGETKDDKNGDDYVDFEEVK